MSKNGEENLQDIKKLLDSVSPSMCLAKWLQVSLHLTNGKTHSCYHPPVHSIDKQELITKFSALHNTKQKKKERALMLQGKKPKGCNYCWKIEDSGQNYSDRHYRSLEPWAKNRFNEVVQNGADYDVTPSYVEVNFNQACQFKCSYCSPHLSSAWADEIKSHGAYPVIPHAHNDIKSLKDKGLWPITGKQDNPYVTAFWKWWPSLYPKLKVFRMTGGEPLIDHNTFRVLDYIEKHPHPDLELAITTNLCPPKKMMERFCAQLKNILKEKKIRRCMIFPSIDTWGKQAEYIRHGLNIDQFESNVKFLLKEIPEVLISFIVTVNALTPFHLKDLLEKILEWQKESFYTHNHNYRRIFFDLPYLQSPAWQALNILPKNLVTNHFEQCLDFMEKNLVNIQAKKYYGFSDFQIKKMKTLIGIVKASQINKEQLTKNKINFYKFFNEHDLRRNTDFIKTFPELESFWLECKGLSDTYDSQAAINEHK